MTNRDLTQSKKYLPKDTCYTQKLLNFINKVSPTDTFYVLHDIFLFNLKTKSKGYYSARNLRHAHGKVYKKLLTYTSGALVPK